MNSKNLEVMFRSYVETALWSSIDDKDRPLDDNYNIGDVLKGTLREMRDDCRSFAKANETDIDGNWELAGQNFWLSRNHHGAGFWDGDWPREAGKRLTDAAHVYGSVDLYIYRGKVKS